MLTPQSVSRILKRRGGDSLNYAPQLIGSFAIQECPQPAGPGPAHVNQGSGLCLG